MLRRRRSSDWSSRLCLPPWHLTSHLVRSNGRSCARRDRHSCAVREWFPRYDNYDRYDSLVWLGLTMRSAGCALCASAAVWASWRARSSSPRLTTRSTADRRGPVKAAATDRERHPEGAALTGKRTAVGSEGARGNSHSKGHFHDDTSAQVRQVGTRRRLVSGAPVNCSHIHILNTTSSAPTYWLGGVALTPRRPARGPNWVSRPVLYTGEIQAK